jgi:hypothetical protein
MFLSTNALRIFIDCPKPSYNSAGGFPATTVRILCIILCTLWGGGGMDHISCTVSNMTPQHATCGRIFENFSHVRADMCQFHL